MLINKQTIKEMQDRKRADFLNRLNGYKSPVLVGTKNNQGNENLTLISSFFHLGANPALLGMIFRPNTVPPRHGLDNILKEKKYSINFIQEEMVQKAHQSSARYDENISEFIEVGLSSIYTNDFPAPFVKESKLKIAMNFIEKIDIKQNGTHLIIGEIEFIEAQKEFSDLSILSDIAVNGLDTYYKVQKITKLSYAKPNTELKEL